MYYTNFHLILSNNYKNLDKYINLKQPNQNDIINLDFAYLIVNEIIFNIIKNPSVSNFIEITLVGGIQTDIWENITQPLIEYIHNRNLFIKINLIIDNENDITEKQLDYCLWNQVNLIVFIKDTTMNLNQLKLILKYKPRTAFKCIVSQNNLFKDYLIFNQLQIKKIYFIYNNINFKNELNYIKDFIITSFNNNYQPLIPYDFHIGFFNNILKQKKIIRPLFNKNIIINQNGNCYTYENNNKYLFSYKELNQQDNIILEELSNNNKFINDLTLKILQQLTLNKNLLFKQYIYICLIEGEKYI